MFIKFQFPFGKTPEHVAVASNEDSECESFDDQLDELFASEDFKKADAAFIELMSAMHSPPVVPSPDNKTEPMVTPTSKSISTSSRKRKSEDEIIVEPSIEADVATNDPSKKRSTTISHSTFYGKENGAAMEPKEAERTSRASAQTARRKIREMVHFQMRVLEMLAQERKHSTSNTRSNGKDTKRMR